MSENTQTPAAPLEIEEAPPVSEASFDRMVTRKLSDLPRATPEAIAEARRQLAELEGSEKP